MRCARLRASVLLATVLGICTLALSAVADAPHTLSRSATSSVSRDDWLLPPDHESLVPSFPSQSTPSALPLPPAVTADTSAVAPLPPALLLGPLGVALVGYATYRLRNRI